MLLKNGRCLFLREHIWVYTRKFMPNTPKREATLEFEVLDWVYAEKLAWNIQKKS